jgi:GNAT superfamily N-acetyltransferase
MDAPTVSIRPVKSQDELPTLASLLAEYEEWLEPDLRHNDIAAPASVPYVLHDGNAAWVAYAGDAPCGCVVVRALEGGDAVLRHLYVRDGARGFGLGRALVQAAIDFAREHGHSRIVLDTERTRLAAAYALYRSMGFRECAPFKDADYECATYLELPLRKVDNTRTGA